MKWPLLCWHRARGLWWFRLFGFGVHWRDARVYPRSFSQRVLGHGLAVGHWHFGLLRRD